MSQANDLSDDFIQLLDLENRIALCEINASTLRKIAQVIPNRREQAQTIVEMDAFDSSKILFRFLIADYLEAYTGFLSLEDNPYMNTIWNELVSRLVKIITFIHRSFDDKKLELESILLEHFKKTPDLFFDLVKSLDLKSAPIFLIAIEDRYTEPGHRLIEHFYGKYEKIAKTRSFR